MAPRDTQWLISVVVGLALALGSGLAPSGAPSSAAAVALEAPPPGASEGAGEAPADMEAGRSEEDATEGDILPWNASECTYALSGYVCIYVWGFGDYVDHVEVMREKSSPICNWQAAMYVNDASGRRIDTRWSPVQHRCDFPQAWYDFSLRRSYPDHSRVCGSFYEDGVKQGGSPCVTLHR